MKKIILPLIYFFLSSYSLFGQFINLKETTLPFKNKNKKKSIFEFNANQR